MVRRQYAGLVFTDGQRRRMSAALLPVGAADDALLSGESALPKSSHRCVKTVYVPRRGASVDVRRQIRRSRAAPNAAHSILYGARAALSNVRYEHRAAQRRDMRDERAQIRARDEAFQHRE